MQNKLECKTFENIVVFFVDVSGYNDDGALIECVLFVRLFHENKGNVSAAVRELRRIKNLLCGPMSAKDI